jgi:arylsulfatase A-like enzyme
MFNAYEETIRVPMVFSNPLLFGSGASSDAPASLVDLVPTLLSIAGAEQSGTLDGVDQSGVLAAAAKPDREALALAGVDFGGVLQARPAARAREHVLFTYDDHQAGTARQEAPGQPNRVRCVRDGRFKYAAYLDPHGRARPEHELYDMEADPIEARNLLERESARPRSSPAARELPRLREILREEARATGTTTPGL